MRVRGGIKKSIALLEDYSSFIYVYSTRKRWDIASDRQLPKCDAYHTMSNVLRIFSCHQFARHPFMFTVLQRVFRILVYDRFKYIIFWALLLPIEYLLRCYIFLAMWRFAVYTFYCDRYWLISFIRELSTVSKKPILKWDIYKDLILWLISFQKITKYSAFKVDLIKIELMRLLMNKNFCFQLIWFK
jgi:hypothetical protein